MLSNKRNRFIVKEDSLKLKASPNSCVNKITNYFKNKKYSYEMPFTKKSTSNKEKYISSKTLYYLIDLFKQRFPREKKQLQILQTYPLKMKYADLLERKLLLPVIFLKLLDSVRRIEKKIDESKECKIQNNKEEIEILNQINYIWSQWYVVNEGKLLINLLGNEINKEKDIELLKNKLIELVKEKHDEFIKQLGIKFPSPYSIGTWHSSFDVEKYFTL